MNRTKTAYNNNNQRLKTKLTANRRIYYVEQSKQVSGNSGKRAAKTVSKDVDFFNGVVKVLGKGNNERLVPVTDAALAALKDYLACRPSPQPQDALFLNAHGKPLTGDGLAYIFKNTAISAHLARKVTPHSLRHSFATVLLKGGADLRVIQSLLGHEHISTTEIYTHLDETSIREEILRCHPRNNHSELKNINN